MTINELRAALDKLVANNHRVGELHACIPTRTGGYTEVRSVYVESNWTEDGKDFAVINPMPETTANR